MREQAAFAVMSPIGCGLSHIITGGCSNIRRGSMRRRAVLYSLAPATIRKLSKPCCGWDSKMPRSPPRRSAAGISAAVPPCAAPRAREILTELMPLLLQAFAAAGDPDAALAGFDLALPACPRRPNFFGAEIQSANLRIVRGNSWRRAEARAHRHQPSASARCRNRSQKSSRLRSMKMRSGSAPDKSCIINSRPRNSSMRCAISRRRNSFPSACGCGPE